MKKKKKQGCREALRSQGEDDGTYVFFQVSFASCCCSHEEEREQEQQQEQERPFFFLFSFSFVSFVVVSARPLPHRSHGPAGVVPPLLRPRQRLCHRCPRCRPSRRRARSIVTFIIASAAPAPAPAVAAVVGRRAVPATSARRAPLGRVRLAGQMAARSQDAFHRVCFWNDVLRGAAAVAPASAGVLRGRGRSCRWCWKTRRRRRRRRRLCPRPLL